jgi:hypothetical protein
VFAFAYGTTGFTPDPPDDAIVRRFNRDRLDPAIDAVARGAYADASSAARRAANDVLDMPAATATSFAEALRTAVEIVEIAPALDVADRTIAAEYFRADDRTREGLARSTALPASLRESFTVRSLPRDSATIYADAHSDSPRLSSLRFVGLQEAMRTGIPDGWAASIRDSVPASRWAELAHRHDDWLRRFSAHPLADYVRLSRARLFYFKGDAGAAWNELLSMYPRHRERVLGEMRFLVYQGMVPASLDDPRIDWPLRTALLMEATVTRTQWTTYWRASEAHAGEGWALPMQERLLWRAVRLAESTRSLPAEFPPSAKSPSALWAQLRLLALLQAGDIPAAFAQIDTAGDAVDGAPIRVRLHLLRNEWGKAIAAAPMREDRSALYLIRVLAPGPIVDSLAAARRSPFVKEAGLTAAARSAAAGDWRTAARLATAADPARARAWTRTATLAAATSRAGQLAFARWMRGQHGRLFFGDDTNWLRGLNWRRDALTRDTTDADMSAVVDRSHGLDPRLPWTAAEERSKIEAHLRATTELYYALQAYGRWLDGATAATPGLAAVVREADQTYNRLLNWDARNSLFWNETLETSREARAIRRAGDLLRRQR